MKTIRDLREEAGLTQLELANAIGSTPGSVYNWERRRSEPRASQLRVMARLFRVSMDDIDFEVVEAEDQKSAVCKQTAPEA